MPYDADLAERVRDSIALFDYAGRPMKGWIYVAPEGLRSDDQLAGWVDSGADFAASLPAKK